MCSLLILPDRFGQEFFENGQVDFALVLDDVAQAQGPSQLRSGSEMTWVTSMVSWARASSSGLWKNSPIGPVLSNLSPGLTRRARYGETITPSGPARKGVTFTAEQRGQAAPAARSRP